MSARSRTAERSRRQFGSRVARGAVFAALFALLCPPGPAAVAQNEPEGAPLPVIIDTDPGTDDAMAILLALASPELDVKAFTVVPGNVTAEQALENTLNLVSLAGRCDIPIAGGAQRPLAQRLITAEFVHGAVSATSSWSLRAAAPTADSPPISSSRWYIGCRERSLSFRSAR